ncbi:early light-induced protein 1, chloroplastic-like [Telopea speciosissima]|uniref:early light-induced protein 1, chloroplastic-like n=1 Tax=Telopea speciosissima TaxID=54955 RepID=UPI001CC72963|nr:early light-induced protein 1, chloroplastic-like [Telopea speciosissima]
MATSVVAVQSILTNPAVTRFTNKCRSDSILTTTYLPSLHRKTSLQVRCMAQKLPQESTKFLDVFAFSGPAPERINGRLAMVGFVTALGVELARGDDLVGQLMNGGVPWFLGTTALLSIASLIPLFKGVSVQSKSDGVMTSDAEMVNGRFAMMGLVALVFTEYLKGGALV